MLAKMILQGLAATVFVAVLAFGYSASAHGPVKAADWEHHQ